MLHVLTGKVKGRKLKAPRGKSVRPTTGRVKKTIFDTLGDITDLKVLDLFAGSGSLGIEALSRDAANVTFIERDALVHRMLKENVARCGFLNRAVLICDHYERALRRLKRNGEKFDLILIDPPFSSYKTKRVDDFIDKVSELLDDGGIVIIEHNYKVEDSPIGFRRVTKPFGGTQLSFFRRPE